jgi:XRE family transcriptional regulator, regulator of sulfur utilization
MGKIERGEHAPTLAIIFKIARALDCSTTALMNEAENQLAAVTSRLDDTLRKTEDQ